MVPGKATALTVVPALVLLKSHRAIDAPAQNTQSLETSCFTIAFWNAYPGTGWRQWVYS